MGRDVHTSVGALLEAGAPDQQVGIIEAILEIELGMFLTVSTQQTSSCQEYPESFKMHRQKEMFRRYPGVMSGARPLTDAGESERMVSFET